MNKIFIALSATALIVMSCQPPASGEGSKELESRLEKLEKKVTALEKRPAGKAARPKPKPQTAAYKIPLGTSAKMGAKDAPVNIVIFSDYQCPYCSKVDPMLHDALKDADLKGKVNVTFKHFPLSFHKDAKPASKAALAAKEQGDEMFWKMSEKLYSDQRNLKPENFSKWAQEIGLDVKKFEQDLKNNDAKYEAEIQADMKLGQSAAQVRGTPSLFVNGWSLKNRSVDGIKALAKDKKLL